MKERRYIVFMVCAIPIFLVMAMSFFMWEKLPDEFFSSNMFILLAFFFILSFVSSLFLTRYVRNYINEIRELNEKLNEKVEIAQKEHQKTNDLFREVFHFVPNFLILFDENLKYLNVNQAYEDIFGIREDEVIGQEIGIKKVIKDVESFNELKRRILNDGGVIEYEYEVYTKLNKSAVFSISVKKIEVDNTIYYILVGKDITSYKELLNKYETLNRDLEKKVREEQEMLLIQSRFATMGEMISMIAHQWRQPLNVLSLILVNINLKIEFGALDENFLKEQIAKADKTIKHMSATIDDFKNLLSKDTTSKVIELKKVVEKAVSIIKPQLDAHAIFLKVKCQDDIKIYANDSELSQVLLNILSNSKDALLEKGIENSTIYISSKIEKVDEDEIVIVSIEDEAGGVDEEIVSKIFEPYFSTKGKNGTGIGLYMSKLIVEKHNGTISASNTQKGLKMEIKFPVYKDIKD